MTYPENIKLIIDRLEDNGESAYIVGGSLRDMLLGVAPHDYDVTTSALPEKTLSVFSDMRVQCHSMNSKETSDGNMIINLTITCRNTSHVNSIVAKLRKIKDVIDVTRGFS